MPGPRGRQLKYYANERQAVHTLSDKLLGHGTHLFALLVLSPVHGLAAWPGLVGTLRAGGTGSFCLPLPTTKGSRIIMCCPAQGADMHAQ